MTRIVGKSARQRGYARQTVGFWEGIPRKLVLFQGRGKKGSEGQNTRDFDLRLASRQLLCLGEELDCEFHSQREMMASSREMLPYENVEFVGGFQLQTA